MGTCTDKLLHYEVDIIYIRRDIYGIREHIPSNVQFGSDRSRCFANENLALEWYDKLTAELYQGVSKVVSGGEHLSIVRVAIYVVYLRPIYSAIQHKDSNPNTYLTKIISLKSLQYEIQSVQLFP
jgi:hypothetical protein